jgi:hypothetical protein
MQQEALRHWPFARIVVIPQSVSTYPSTSFSAPQYLAAVLSLPFPQDFRDPLASNTALTVTAASPDVAVNGVETSVPSLTSVPIHTANPTVATIPAAVMRWYILPASIRPVKDVVYCVPDFAAWHAVDPTVHLLIMGPVLDTAYGAMVKTQCARPGKCPAR